MKHWKTVSISSFGANHENVGRGVPKNIPVFRVRRQDGFTLIEVLVVIVIIMIALGFAVFGWNREDIYANQAMSQVANSLREARMIALSKNRRVSVHFANANSIVVQVLDGGAWRPINDIFPAPQTHDPSTSLGHGFQFSRNGLADTPDGEGGTVNTAAICFGGNTFIPGTPPLPDKRLVFTADDGILTIDGFPHDPVNGTIFIGLPDNINSPARAITIMGATSNINTWRFRDAVWVRR